MLFSELGRTQDLVLSLGLLQDLSTFQGWVEGEIRCSIYEDSSDPENTLSTCTKTVFSDFVLLTSNLPKAVKHIEQTHYPLIIQS